MGALNTKLVYCSEVVSCHREHSSDNRVTCGEHSAYLRDEAWFLPRLYDCTVKAGVRPDSPEMRHFSRWVVMWARQLGAMDESITAWDLYDLAEKSVPQKDLSMKLIEMFARNIGWKLTGQISGIYESFWNFLPKKWQTGNK